MANFTGQLRSNEIFGALYNMIISQEVFADNIKGTNSSLVDASRVDGSLYGDTKLYYSTDVLKSVPWGNDAETANLLQTHRPPAPECQAIHLDVFRQIALTVDNYLSKRAWGTESAFSSFNSVMLGWIRDTKRVYDSTLFNAYVGTATSIVGQQNQTVTLPTATDPESQARLQAGAIAEKLANVLVDLEDVTRDYNDYQNLRSFNSDDLVVVWNSAWVNKIKKVDMPTIFHKEGLIDKFAEYTLPARYFGTQNISGGQTADGSTIRALVEADYREADDPDLPVVHCFPGDVIPIGATIPDDNAAYTVDPKIICKIMHKRSIPYMSAFEVGTSFFNPKALNENHYLTFGHNTLEYLKNYPMITIKQA